MKKYIGSILLLVVAILLVGCGKDEQEAFYIPTPTLASETPGEEEVEEPDESDESGEADEVDTPFVGNTTTMYVKLGDYDAILNVRDLPSKEGAVVGFLVHTEQVEVIEIVDGWASFIYDNNIAYVSSTFLKEEKPEYIAPPTPTKKPAKPSQPNDSPQEI